MRRTSRITVGLIYHTRGPSGRHSGMSGCVQSWSVWGSPTYLRPRGNSWEMPLRGCTEHDARQRSRVVSGTAFNLSWLRLDDRSPFHRMSGLGFKPEYSFARSKMETWTCCSIHCLPPGRINGCPLGGPTVFLLISLIR